VQALGNGTRVVKAFEECALPAKLDELVIQFVDALLAPVLSSDSHQPVALRLAP